MIALAASKRIALYGGSFDPPHVAHVMTVAWLLSAAPIDEVWIMPVAKHYLAKVVSKFDDRVLMCRLAFGLFGDRVQVRMDEQELAGAGASIDLIAHLQKKYPAHVFSLAIGSDILHQRLRWKQFDKLQTLVRLIILPRPGFSVDAEFFDRAAPVLLPDVSSTQLRADLIAGRRVDGRLPLSVGGWLQRGGQHLYI